MEKRRADLHIHTNCSDGTFTPLEVVELASSKGISCISICDHDTVSGVEEAMLAGRRLGVEIIPGVEISAEENGKELHILGYFVDYKDENFTRSLDQVREDRKERLFKIVDALNQYGIDIQAKDLLVFAGDVSISRLHIAKYLLEKGFVDSLQQAFNKYIGDNAPCYVANFRYSVKEAIELIKSAKGIPVVAHPGLNNVKDFLPDILEAGIEGIEVYHTRHNSALVSYYTKYAKANNLFMTGGSDCHGLNKEELLIGTVTVPYAFVEEMRN
ncbi:MAG: PHP domain-containing protein [Candidatus Omnitrophota bacterium]